MLRIVACVMALLNCVQFASAETLILWSKEARACGANGYTYRAGYTIEAMPTEDLSAVNERLKSIIAAAKSEGAENVYKATVPAKSCVAVAYMDKQVGSCGWRTFTWKIAKDEATARADVEKVLRGEVNVKSSMVQEVRCASPARLRESYSAGGVRG